jgi:hypothetical protein
MGNTFAIVLENSGSDVGYPARKSGIVPPEVKGQL